MSDALLLSVQTGRTAPLGPDSVPSAFVKTSRQGAVAVTRLGLEGDEQADLAVHGGFEKAVYAYSSVHYPQWAAEFPQLADHFTGGAMGENLTVSGLEESRICVGDVHKIGSALLQVCQPRQPCFKFGLRHDNKYLPKAMVRNGFSGWYYRVLEPGEIGAGDSVERLARPHPEWSVARLLRVLYVDRDDRASLEGMAALDALSPGWRKTAAKRLESGQVESWTSRLDMPAG